MISLLILAKAIDQLPRDNEMTAEMIENIRLILKPLKARRAIITDEQFEEVFALAQKGLATQTEPGKEAFR